MSLKPIVLQFVIDNFETLPHQVGHRILSEVKDDGNGNSWQVQLYPGGRDEESNGHLSMFLHMTKGAPVDAIAAFIIRDALGNAFRYHKMSKSHFGGETSSWGYKKLDARSTVLADILHDGALVIDVEFQIIDKKRKYQPSNPAFTNMQNLFGSDQHADVQFKVENEIVPAHKLILSINAPILAEFCGGNASPVLINDTKLDVFRTVLRYIYGGDIPEEDVILRKGKEILEAANRYEIIDLKMAVENSLVEQRALQLKNAADWLVFADSNTCPLLKEYALSYVACRAKDVLAHKSSANLKESPKLMEELVLATSKDESNDRFSRDDGLSVDDLRAKLDAQGLDVDGSKETLLARLAASKDTDEDDMEVQS